ncbi:MAG: hypothetical protein AB7I79_18545 [Rhizobiaceae bacterium]
MKQNITSAMALIGLVFVSAPALAERLEDIQPGAFRASGKIVRAPGKPVENLYCKLEASRTDGGRFSIGGRCATSMSSGSVTMDFAVVTPGERYRLDVELAGNSLPGTDPNSHFDGAGKEGGAVFRSTAPLTVEGQTYDAELTIAVIDGKPVRMWQTVTPTGGGERTTVLDLAVKP